MESSSLSSRSSGMAMDPVSAPQLLTAEPAKGIDRADLDDGADSFPAVDEDYHEVEIIPTSGLGQEFLLYLGCGICA
jgi:hypothetical protein